MYFYLYFFTSRSSNKSSCERKKLLVACSISCVYISLQPYIGNSLHPNRKSWERKVLLSLSRNKKPTVYRYVHISRGVWYGKRSWWRLSNAKIRRIAQTHRSFYWQSGWLTYFLALRKEVRLLCIVSFSPFLLRIARSHRTVALFFCTSISWLGITSFYCSCVPFSWQLPLFVRRIACLREIETGSSESHDPAWGGYYARVRRAVESVVPTVAICFAIVRRLMYKMARKSNERKAVSSDGSHGSSLPRTVIYRCWTIHEERALMRTAAALFI